MPRLRLALFILAIACLANPQTLDAYCPHFTVGVRALTGAGAAGIAAADFNGDGKMDVAVASRDSNKVFVYLGDGTGGDGTGFTGFLGQAEYTVGTSPVALAAGDFNGDGKPDLAVANASDTFSILVNNGNGTFAAALTYAAGSSPRAIAVGDMNRDGDLDIVIANYLGDNVRIHFGNGDATFGFTPFAAGSHPTGVTVADFNGDGRPDMAVTDEGADNVAVILSLGPPNPSGFFAAAVFYPVGDSPAGITAARFNQDGYIDLAVATSVNSSVLINNGSGVFTAGTETIYAGTHVSAGDFNGDGTADLAIASNLQLIIVELSLSGAQIFTEVDFVGTPQGGFVVADMSSDGRLDVIDTEPAYNRITLNKNSGRCFANCGSFASGGAFATGTSPFGIAAANLNGDGAVDLAVPNNGSNNVSILIGNGTGFEAPVNYPTGAGSFAAAAGDLDRDGYNEVVVANTNANTITILRGSQAGTFTPTNYPAGFAPYSVSITDFNGDAYPDLAIASPNDDTVSVWMQTTMGTFNITPQSVGSVPFFATVGDFNGDGKMDIASANHGTASVSIRLGNGDGTFAAATSYDAGTQPRFIVAADFNHDGKPDLAVANSGSDNVSILLGTGGGAFGAATDYAVGDHPVFMAVGDFNLDGNADVVAVNQLGGSISVLTSSASGIFTPLAGSSTGSNSNAVAVGDFDRDGKPDIATVVDGSNSVVLRMNRCLFAELNVEKSHVGNFSQGESGAEYRINVYNIGTASTNAPVTVVDTLPPALIATGITGVGPGWSCDLPSLTCTSSDTVAAGASYSEILLTVKVRSNAPATVTNSATLTGGGDTDPDNNTSSDETNVNAVSLIAPTGLVATAQSTAQINLTWDAVTDANGYGVFRTSSSGTDEFLAPSPNFTDTAVLANTTYVYQVAAVTPQNTVGPGSNKDLATTFLLTDDPLVPTIKAVHFTELRSTVNMVRAAAILADAPFTDTIAPGVLIRVIHLAELRTYLDEARAILGVSQVSYTDPMFQPGTVKVKAAHILELRSGIK